MGKRATAKYNLKILFPDISKEWHPTKNGDKKPEDYCPGSGKLVWWQCKKGHEWQVTINNRTNSGSGCRQCHFEIQGGLRKKTEVAKKGSLADKNPELAKEWHPDKNGDKTPGDFTSGSGEKVWWLCEEGHEWEAAINNRRTGKGTGCPKCYNLVKGSIKRAKIVRKKGSLADNNRDLANEWHPDKNGDKRPEDYSTGSRENIWWLCKEGHEWEAAICDRSNGRGCQECYRQVQGEKYIKSLINKNGSALKNYPELIHTLHPTKNLNKSLDDFTSGSKEKFWWLCEENQLHEWEAQVKDRINGSGCPFCQGLQIAADYNLLTEYPEIADEWHPEKNGEVTPDKIPPLTNKKYWWQCNRGHEWKTSPNSRVSGDTGCPTCKPQTSKTEIRIYCEIKSIFSDVKWREKFHGQECDIYIPRYQVGIENDGFIYHKDKIAKDINKNKILEQHGITVFRLREGLEKINPHDISYKERDDRLVVIKELLKSMLKATGLSDEDKTRVKNYLSCDKFQNDEDYREIVSILPGPLPEKSIESTHKEIVKEWDYKKNNPLEPRMFSHGSHEKVWWVCDKKHPWQQVIATRIRGVGCMICWRANKKK